MAVFRGATKKEDDMKLIEGERNLIESEDKVVLLTTHRIRYNAEKIGVTDFGSIMLEEVASCTSPSSVQSLELRIPRRVESICQ